jgi:hypothetical protein
VKFLAHSHPVYFSSHLPQVFFTSPSTCFRVLGDSLDSWSMYFWEKNQFTNKNCAMVNIQFHLNNFAVGPGGRMESESGPTISVD